MSKELWVRDYERKLIELGDDPDAERKAVEYAEGHMERLIDQADSISKAIRERNDVK